MIMMTGLPGGRWGWCYASAALWRELDHAQLAHQGRGLVQHELLRGGRRTVAGGARAGRDRGRVPPGAPGALAVPGFGGSFAGIEGKARYHATPVEDALPVLIAPMDDRVERPAGVLPDVVAARHPVLRDVPGP